MRPDSELQRRVVLGVDDSEHSERAFDCKYMVINQKKKNRSYSTFEESFLYNFFAYWARTYTGLLHA